MSAVSNPYIFNIDKNYNSSSDIILNFKYILQIGKYNYAEYYGVWNKGSFNTPPAYIFGNITPNTYETNGYIKGIFVREFDKQFRVEVLGYTYSSSQIMIAELFINNELYTYELPWANNGRSPAYTDFAVYGGDLIELFKNNINKNIKVNLKIK